jgi:CRP/FNR family transcriptional regulator, anaerobic regulatory protein
MSDEICRCTVEEHIMCAEKVPIFSSLDKNERKQVVSLIIQKKFEKDSLIISEGSIPQNLIIISRGKIKVYGYSQDGKEQIMYILTDGDFFGARSLIHEQKADFNLQAMENTRVCMIERREFQKLLVKFPGISIKIMEVLCDRLEKMESLVRKISPKDVDSRINMMLLELSQKYGRKHSSGILLELPMSREEMANYIGVARETVSRKLTSLKYEGIIEMIGTKRIIILNEEALESSI